MKKREKKTVRETEKNKMKIPIHKVNLKKIWKSNRILSQNKKKKKFYIKEA